MFIALQAVKDTVVVVGAFAGQWPHVQYATGGEYMASSLSWFFVLVSRCFLICKCIEKKSDSLIQYSIVSKTRKKMRPRLGV